MRIFPLGGVVDGAFGSMETPIVNLKSYLKVTIMSQSVFLDLHLLVSAKKGQIIINQFFFFIDLCNDSQNKPK